jgi:predicted metal-dependent hydrolase
VRDEDGATIRPEWLGAAGTDWSGSTTIELEVFMGSAFERGAHLYDAGQYFEAHEAWEERWKATTDATERRFLQGLIQIAAAFHQLLVRRSPASADRLLARGLAKLDACPPRVEGLDLAAFRESLRACALGLARNPEGPVTIPPIAASLLPTNLDD